MHSQTEKIMTQELPLVPYVLDETKMKHIQLTTLASYFKAEEIGKLTSAQVDECYRILTKIPVYLYLLDFCSLGRIPYASYRFSCNTHNLPFHAEHVLVELRDHLEKAESLSHFNYHYSQLEFNTFADDDTLTEILDSIPEIAVYERGRLEISIPKFTESFPALNALNKKIMTRDPSISFEASKTELQARKVLSIQLPDIKLLFEPIVEGGIWILESVTQFDSEVWSTFIQTPFLAQASKAFSKFVLFELDLQTTSTLGDILRRLTEAQAKAGSTQLRIVCFVKHFEFFSMDGLIALFHALSCETLLHTLFLWKPVHMFSSFLGSERLLNKWAVESQRYLQPRILTEVRESATDIITPESSMESLIEKMYPLASYAQLEQLLELENSLRLMHMQLVDPDFPEQPTPHYLQDTVEYFLNINAPSKVFLTELFCEIDEVKAQSFPSDLKVGDLVTILFEPLYRPFTISSITDEGLFELISFPADKNQDWLGSDFKLAQLRQSNLVPADTFNAKVHTVFFYTNSLEISLARLHQLRGITEANLVLVCRSTLIESVKC